MPEFIVLRTTSATGAQKVWTEIARPVAKDAASAFQSISPLEAGTYLILPTSGAFSATVTTTVKVG